jgi:hypothetical protein
MQVRRFHGGPHFSRPGVSRTYRGSPKRIRRIKWRDHTPPSFVAWTMAGLVVLLAVIYWLMTHPEAGHHHGG